MPIRPDDEGELVTAVAAKSTAELWRSRELADRAELHWRLSFPLSLFVLGVLAIPLSRTAPREGRYARLGTALFIYLIYTGWLSIGRVWVERGIVSELVGLWWIHGIVGFIALWGIAVLNGVVLVSYIRKLRIELRKHNKRLPLFFRHVRNTSFPLRNLTT